MSFSISLAGCSIGVKDHVSIVYTSFAKSPIEASGAIKIATNAKIPVTVGDKVTTLDLGGMYAIKGSDLKAFVNAIKLQKNAGR